MHRAPDAVDAVGITWRCGGRVESEGGERGVAARKGFFHRHPVPPLATFHSNFQLQMVGSERGLVQDEDGGRLAGDGGGDTAEAAGAHG
eukprot:94143-Rhodomonas_salina.1